LDAKGEELLYATYLGGTGNELAASIAVDMVGRAVVTGITSSSDLPTTPGAYDTSYNGGISPFGPNNFEGDGFVTQLDVNGANLRYSTFFGGTSDDEAWDIVLDSSENACVTGYTTSADYPVTLGAYDSSFNGGMYYGDVFVTKFDLSATGSASLVASTFLGGSSEDGGVMIAVDSWDNIYLVGITYSADFPISPWAFQTSLFGGDVYVAKLDESASNMFYSSYLGGTGEEGGWGIAADDSGNVYVTGYTTSVDFPTTSYAPYTSYNGGFWDVFVTKLDTVEHQLEFLIEQVESLIGLGVLNPGQGTSLITKLEMAIQLLDQGNVNAASNLISAFTQQVSAYVNAEILTPLQGQTLIDMADHIHNQLN
jgi:hypothetical protein